MDTDQTSKSDTRADTGGVTEDDWARIDELLHASWRSLHGAVNS